MPVTIRALTAADAETVATMSQKFNQYLRNIGDDDPYHFNAQRYLEDGFGDDPAFSGHIAELDGKALGYVLHCFSYDVDLAMRQMDIIDLWVEPDQRGYGTGYKLMQAAAKHAATRRAARLVWAVLRGNQTAFDFYRRLGASDVEGLDWMTIETGVLAASR